MQPLSKAKLRLFRSLLLKKQRYKHLLFIAEGIKMVQEAFQSDWEVTAVIIREDAVEKCEEIFTLFDEEKRFVIGEKEFSQLCTQEHPEGILAIVSIPADVAFLKDEITWEEIGHGPGFVLDRIQDPGNLGTILRIAHWFGWEKVICLEGTVDVLNPKVIRSSMGALFFLDIYYCKSETTLFRDSLANIWMADMKGRPLKEVKFGANDWVVLGNEAGGINDLLKDIAGNNLLHIPGAGKAESLNVSIAAGIIAYEYFSQSRHI